jgi:hypothetical protein
VESRLGARDDMQPELPQGEGAGGGAPGRGRSDLVVVTEWSGDLEQTPDYMYKAHMYMVGGCGTWRPLQSMGRWLGGGHTCCRMGVMEERAPRGVMKAYNADHQPASHYRYQQSPECEHQVDAGLGARAGWREGSRGGEGSAAGGDGGRGMMEAGI